MDIETSEVEHPDQEWQLVSEAIDVIREAGLDAGIMEIASRFVQQGADYRVVFEIVCNDRVELLKHLPAEKFPNVGEMRVCDTKLPEEYKEHERPVPFPMVSVRLLYNEHPYVEAKRYDPNTMQPINPVIISEYDAVSVKVTPNDTFIGGETVRMRPGKATEVLSSEGKELVRFSNREVASGLNKDMPHRIGVIMAEVVDEFPPIPQT